MTQTWKDELEKSFLKAVLCLEEKNLIQKQRMMEMIGCVCMGMIFKWNLEEKWCNFMRKNSCIIKTLNENRLQDVNRNISFEFLSCDKLCSRQF